MPVKLTRTVKPADRAAWRNWLATHGETSREIWVLFDDRPSVQNLPYLDSVEEAICFGWIDGLAKRVSEVERAQRFSPRRPRGNWTELNKERARRLIRLGLMTDAGRATLPDLSVPFHMPEAIVDALKASPLAWEHFQIFPDLYRRVRVGYVEEMRKNPTEFARRLSNFVKKTTLNQMFGNWNDGGRLS